MLAPALIAVLPTTLRVSTTMVVAEGVMDPAYDRAAVGIYMSPLMTWVPLPTTVPAVVLLDGCPMVRPWYGPLVGALLTGHRLRRPTLRWDRMTFCIGTRSVLRD